MKIRKKKKIILTILSIVGIMAISAAFALYRTSFSVTNEFTVTGAKADFREIFDAPESGDNPFEDGTEETDVPTPDNPAGTDSLVSSYTKKGIVVNNGDVDVRVRASITAKWVMKENPNTELPDLNTLPDNKTAAWLDFNGKTYIESSDTIGFPYVNTAKIEADAAWKYVADDQMFYYIKDNGVISKNSAINESDALLGKIVFNKELLGAAQSTGKYYVKAEYDTDPETAASYESQADAKAAAVAYAKANPGKDAVILYEEVSAYTLYGYDKAKLVVTIAGDIVDADSVTVDTDGTWKNN